MSSKRKASVLEKTLNKYRHGQKAASKIMTAAARDRAALDARSDAQYERMKRRAEEEAAAIAAMELEKPPEPPKVVVATNLLAKQKHAIDTLFQQRRPMSNDDLRVFLGFDCNVGPLFDSLRNHEKVSYDEDTGLFRYKAKHDVMCKDDVLELVNSMPDGLTIDEIVDAYVKAKEDAMTLVEEDAVILLTNTETKQKVLFRKQQEYEIEIKEDFVASFHNVEIPEHDVDFDKALRREGIEPTPRPVYDLGPAPEVEKKKKKRQVNFERMNVTNAHMPELFKAAQVERLDG